MLLVLAYALLFLPLVVHFALLWWSGRRPGVIGPGYAFLLATALALLTPIGAGLLAVRYLEAGFAPGQPRCLIGAGLFFVLGYLLSAVGLPLIALLHWAATRLVVWRSRRVAALHQ